MEATELRPLLSDLKSRIETLTVTLKLEELTTRIGEIEAKMSEPGFWDNAEAAQGLMDEMKALKAVSGPLTEASGQLDDLNELLDLAEAEDDSDTFEEVAGEAQNFTQTVMALETRALLSGPNDKSDVYFSIHAGAGGNDACECAELLLRMYLRFFERKGWKVEELTYTPGEDAGLRGATYNVSGDHVFGHMRGEIGVHRIVRMSPFSGKRETSFVSVDAMPEYDSVDIEIDENDLRVDTYRSSGKGGQHVNKTDSAVRLTHIPTGVVVAVQNERSQHKNKAMAMKLLKIKLQRLEEAKREKEMASLYSEKGEIAFGSQIRNYVFQPYTQVKDARTNCENGNIQAVMDGELHAFVEAYLRWWVSQSR
ncbi:MAG: peptide chain release factor 2 [Planctomycetota bacterium]|jgi:peptide chain release factor 2